MLYGFNQGNVTPEQWSSITLALAKTTEGNYHDCLKWLRVIWHEDRRGVRTEVLHAGRLTIVNVLCCIAFEGNE